MNKRMLSLGGLALAGALILAGCGGKEETSNASPETSQAAAGAAKAITLNAKNFEFDQPEIKLKKGETVSITLKNGQGNHAVHIDGYDKDIKGKETVTFTADKAGEFKFFCSIMCGAGHGDMVGKIIVE